MVCPASERTATPVDSLFNMKLADLEKTLEPMFAMWKTQRDSVDEAFGDFTHRVGIPAVEKYMETYKPGAWSTLPDPFAKKLVTTDRTVGIDGSLLAQIEKEAQARGYDASTLLDIIAREALDLE
jgi:sulfite reductase (ferredoxin)